MKISYNWLKELIDFETDYQKLAELFTMSGSEVEAIEPKGQQLAGIVSARILEVNPHPNADKLTLCLIDNGKEKITLVCGAPNARPGINVLMGGIDSVIADGRRLAKAKIRGVESAGMILAEDELGISADHGGIIELPENIKLGTPLDKIVNLTDWIYELEITPNRPDCLSHIGMARELKALLGGKIKYPKISLNEIQPASADDLTIEIVDPDGCPRYTGRLVSDVTVGQSPLWLKARLFYLGMRPINNIVDITNYVMMETGQPLHAFDYKHFQSKKVVVRKASAGEKFTTLDGTERTLNDNHLLITDGEKAVALAGIMGGLNSEVTAETKQILLESAYFNPVVTRYGAKAVGLSTESSQRFERGADPLMAPTANDRACQLLAELAGGKIHKGIVDCYPKKFVPVSINFRPQRARVVLGLEIPNPLMKDIFNGLDIPYMEGTVLKITQPSFRPDLIREIDLVEEIARIHGLDNIPESYRPGGSLLKDANPALLIKNRLRALLVGMGFVETFPLTLIDAQQLKKLDESIEVLTLQNPLSEELSGLRPNLAVTMIKTLRHNINYGNKDLRLFDIGKAYTPSTEILPKEKEILCLGLSGKEHPISWRNPEKSIDIFTLKGILETLLSHLNIEKIELVAQKYPYFDKDYSFTLTNGPNILGRLGKVAAAIGRSAGLKQEVFIAELDFAMLVDLALEEKHFRSLPKFPGSDRDIALIVDESIQAAAILQLIKQTGGTMIEDLFPFDLYQGKNIPDSKKSIAFRICYRCPDRTLTDDEVDGITSNIVTALAKEFGATLRT
jgi:phenylalanyl-tRNA synthetase beta chain